MVGWSKVGDCMGRSPELGWYSRRCWWGRAGAGAGGGGRRGGILSDGEHYLGLGAPLKETGPPALATMVTSGLAQCCPIGGGRGGLR
jgi:hypothetical protein